MTTPSNSTDTLVLLNTPNNQLIKSTTYKPSFKSPFPLESLTQRIKALTPHSNIYTGTAVRTYHTIHTQLHLNIDDTIIYTSFVTTELLIQYISVLLITLLLHNITVYVFTHTLLGTVSWYTYTIHQFISILFTTILYCTQAAQNIPILYLLTNYKQNTKLLLQRLIKLCTVPTILLFYNRTTNVMMNDHYIQYGVSLYAIYTAIDKVLLNVKHPVIQNNRLYLFQQALYSVTPQSFVYICKYQLLYTVVYCVTQLTIVDTNQLIQLLYVTLFIEFIYRLTDAMIDILCNEYHQFDSTVLYCLYTDQSIDTQHNCLVYVQNMKDIDKLLCTADINKYIQLKPVSSTQSKSMIVASIADSILLYCIYHINQLIDYINDQKSSAIQKSLVERMIESITHNIIYSIQYNQFIVFRRIDYYKTVINVFCRIILQCTCIDRQYINQSIVLLLTLYTTIQQYLKLQQQNLSFMESNYIQQHTDQWNFKQINDISNTVQSNITTIYNVYGIQLQYELTASQCSIIESIRGTTKQQ